MIERAERVAAAHADMAADRSSIEAGLRAAAQLRSWLAATDAALVSRLKQFDAFPEKTVADCTRGSVTDGAKATERSSTLDAVPGFADALADAAITAEHVDALTRAGKQLDTDAQRAELFDRAGGLVDVAAAASVDEFRRRLHLEVRGIRADDGMARLQRQRRNTRLSTWTDDEGMWRLSGRFDPVTGVGLAARLDAAVQALFAEATPDTCPTDPVAKQQHLRALALARLVDHDSSSSVGVRPGRPEFIVVVDTTTPDGAGGPTVDWGIPVEIPTRVLADIAGDATVHPIVVRNGVILHAPGALDLGRSTRLASAAQRRALRALYSTCAIPGCSVRYSRCKLHHIVWWRNGGSTDLANLLPVCAHHHTKIHDHGWGVSLDDHRQLTIRLPDGHVMTTGPPKRTAA